MMLLAGLLAPAAVGAQEDARAIQSGAYASRQDVSSRARMRPANRYVRVVTTSLLIHRVVRVGDRDSEATVTSRYCSVEQGRLGRVRTTLGQAFVNGIPEWEATLRVTGPTDGGWSVEIEERAVVVGAALADPWNDPLPTRPDDTSITDPDGDGQPGFTVDVEGYIDGQVYMVQRLVRGLRGTLEADGRMSGRVTGFGDQEILGASNKILEAFTPRFQQDPDESRHTFVWVRVPDEWTCQNVVAAGPRLFAED
jgi:hypothetical protein